MKAPSNSIDGDPQPLKKIFSLLFLVPISEEVTHHGLFPSFHCGIYRPSEGIASHLLDSDEHRGHLDEFTSLWYIVVPLVMGSVTLL